jgi:dihydrofolate reductase
MSKVSLIVAMDRNRCIGIKNTLPWHISDDLKRFKAITLGKPVIMGRKTFESLGRPLPGRLNVVISRTKQEGTEDVAYVTSLEAGLAASDAPELMIIGGGQIYAQALALADRVYLTEVDTIVEGDTFFPELSLEWALTEIEGPFTDEKSGLSFSYKTYDRRA